MSVSLQQVPELDMVSLLELLAVYAEKESQDEPYLVKNGITIIL